MEGAKQIASNLFAYYDRDGQGNIDTVKVLNLLMKVLPMLANAYKVMNSNFNPQKEDVNSFFHTLDVDKNNKVTLQDMENLCVRYLTGTTLGVPYTFHDHKKY